MENTIILFVCSPKILHEHCFCFLLRLLQVPRETENNAYAKFGGTGKDYYGIFQSGLYERTSFVTIATYWVPDLPDIEGFAGHVWPSILIFTNDPVFKNINMLDGVCGLVKYFSGLR